MSKLNPSFMEQIEKDIKLAESNAEVFVDTQVVNFKPQYNDKVTEESMKEHIDFANYQGALMHGALSNIQYDNFEKVGDKPWTGVMDFGGALTITAHSNMRDEVDADTTVYGQMDVMFDYKHSDDLSAWYDHFNAADEERCRKLFEEN